MENIPRRKGPGCLSLRCGSIVTALVVLLYCPLSLYRCFMELSERALLLDFNRWESLATISITVIIIVVLFTSFMLSALMMLGALKEHANMIKPWVIFKSIQIIVEVLLTLWMIVIAFNDFVEIYILQFVSILIKFYMLIIVASYYKELLEKKYKRNFGNVFYTEV